MYRAVDSPVHGAPGQPAGQPAGCAVAVHPLWTGETSAVSTMWTCGADIRAAAASPVAHPAGPAAGSRTGRSSGSPSPRSARWSPSRCSCSPTRPSSATWALRSWPGSGVAGALLATSVSVCVFLAYGTTAAVARRVGAGDLRAAVAQGVDGIWLALVIGVLLAGGSGRRRPTPLVAAFGTAADATPYALTYLRVSLVGLPAMLVVLAATGVLRGLQDTRTPLVVATVGAVANVVLNLLLVYGARPGHRRFGARHRDRPGRAWRRRSWSSSSAARAAKGRRCGPTCPASGPPAAPGVPLVVRTVTLRAALLLMTYVATAAGHRRDRRAPGGLHDLAVPVADARRGRDRRAGHRRPLPRRRGRRGHPGVDPADGGVGLWSGVAARRRAARAARRVRPAVHRGPGRPVPARVGAGRRGGRPAGLRRRLRARRRADRRRGRPLPGPGPGS